ncbi:MAG TPA: type 2 lanthipeptide synthetase LanM family protein [Bryobacteraceae bacterium]|jgi:type 2 lantibiotic biosynthesis protein LanM|nr:type 2 lanthipeptide synthetase LanM family protein [Bryobacteraceae bacterium]
MNEKLLRSLNLSERWSLCRDVLANERIDDTPAPLLVEQWRERTRDYWSRKLSVAGIPDGAFSALVTPEFGRLIQRRLPLWLEQLAAILDDEAPSGVEPGPDLAVVCEPIVQPIRDRLRSELISLSRENPSLVRDAVALERNLYAQLHPQLLTMAGRAVVLEYHAALLEQGGAKPKKQFMEEFLERLRSRCFALRMYEEYPVLARLVFQRTEQWAQHSKELLGRLANDRADIQNTFQVELEGVSRILLYAGDRHAGGRSVAVLSFESGTRVVYRPRTVRVYRTYEQLQLWLNAHGFSPQFRPVRTLDCGGYGWIEHIAAEACKSGSEIHEFYFRMGATLALSYALGMTDLHAENVIAHGKIPVLVDLESVLHPETPGSIRYELAALAESVLRVGLLPPPTARPYDTSGLKGADGQELPFAPAMAALRDDELIVDRVSARTAGLSNRPWLEGQSPPPIEDYIPDVVKGFESLYAFLASHHEQLLAPGGPLAQFADAEIRVILRPTAVYAFTLHESLHPDFLGDAVLRDQFFDRLWDDNATGSDFWSTTVGVEQDEMWRGDIPLFSSTPNSKRVRTSGGEWLPGELAETSLERARRRILSFSAADRMRQVWFMKASLALSSKEDAIAVHRPRWLRDDSSPTGGLGDATSLVRRLADRINTLFDPDRANWAVMSTDKGRWRLRSADADLYDGLPGIIIALLQVNRYVRGTPLEGVVEPAVQAFLRRVAQVRVSGPRLDPGAFSGWAGVLYCLAYLASERKEAGMLELAAGIAKDTVSPLIDNETECDIVLGIGGCLAVCCELHRKLNGGGTFLELAEQCGKRILALAVREEGCAYWRTQIPSARPLVGFSHGVSGIAWALLQLFRINHDSKLWDAAMAALGYERQAFSGAHQNWPDYRIDITERQVSTAGDTFQTAWCHGAVGIGMMRCDILDLMEDDGPIREEIRTAVATTLGKGLGNNHCLCHGDLGSIEFLQAAVACGEADPARIASVLRKTCTDISTNGPCCSTPLGVETPSLMRGLSGILHGLLRAEYPGEVPSILRLRLPLN